jgi:hypothetical protein
MLNYGTAAVRTFCLVFRDRQLWNIGGGNMTFAMKRDHNPLKGERERKKNTAGIVCRLAAIVSTTAMLEGRN